ncbi:PREDICTED: uncharacterized protein LOC105570992 [Vollenhovia emeryi]|uniref:uncharacterized protein LOC105570992 n=1 Tax=Vollenhovia emeryi TaxID=411798 RepID=UPI0005F41954|nr:PREDICTED: uncharacterized protein LOC105570992 [Vollenhovia emeryi]
MRVSHIESRIEQQLTLKELIDTAIDRLIRVGYANITPQRVNARLASLKESWEKFSLVHDAIGLAISRLNSEDATSLLSHSYFSEGFFSSTHENYLEAVEKMNLLLEQETGVTHRMPSTPSGSHTSATPSFFHHARLPRIDLPKFNGSPADWLSFKDLFSSLVVDNPTLTLVERLQYLKTSLTGSASHLLKNTTLTADNFQKAWDALIAFYENKRLLVNAALHSLLSLKRMTRESAAEMEQLYTNVMQIYRTLETLKRPVQSWDDFLVFIAVQRLDAESVKAWEHTLGLSKEPPTWNQFSEFLVTRLLSLQAFEKSRMSKPQSQGTVKSHFQGKGKDNTNKTVSCAICGSNHYVSSCPQYTSKTVLQRLAIINKFKLCFNCLGSHRAAVCRITKRCQKCGHKHHTTIHQTKPVASDPGTNKSTDSSEKTSKPSDAHVLHSSKEKTTTTSVLLATAQVTIVNSSGETAKARALVDQGSEITLISERLVQLLRLPRVKSSISLVGVGAQKSNQTKGLVSFQMRPHFKSKSEYRVSAHILHKLTGSIPSISTDKKMWPHIQNLQLADNDFTSPEHIDLILGADVYAQILEEGVMKGDANSPIAQRTSLGWIISGPSGINTLSNKVQGYHISLDSQLYELIHRFWDVEEIPSITPSLLSPEDLDCEQHFLSTHTRDDQGRYIVRLPFKHPPENLGDSKSKAFRVINGLSRKLESDPEYSTLYFDFLKEYEQMQHMTRVLDSQSEPPIAYYLPHHGVKREGSSTTKLRVVFNGSSRSSTGWSLNDILHTGAKLQVDLLNVLLWFRQFRYVFSSDVEKMYRQIKIHKADWDFQRILWMDTFNKISTYQLTTVTYGLACAPFLALRSLDQLIADEGAKFPLAVPVLQRGRYVDDIFGGGDFISEAQEIAKQTNQLCMAGGFPLHKWVSNNPDVLQSIPTNKQDGSSSFQIEDHTMTNALGLCWKPLTDTFHFTMELTSTSLITKRSVLSSIAKLFDPLGLVSPVIIKAKILMQELWSIKLGWDDPLPLDVATKWKKFVEQLHDLPHLEFPRWLGTRKDHVMEIHGFCDASQRAMCAAVYIRVISNCGEITTNIVYSKTKVAPLKRLTIPRLELSGAVILVKLVTRILLVWKLESPSIYLWTDSALTYTWINNHPSRWKDYIHNRVCFIQESLPHAIWRFVPGTENPADCATRGLTPNQLSQHSTWWTGPPWLQLSPSSWPQTPQSPKQGDNLEERAPQVSVATQVKSTEPWTLIDRYSSITRLLRITAWCRRSVARFQRSSDNSTGPLTTHELEASKIYWVKTIQQSHFQRELSILSKGDVLPRSNSLLRLTPIMDSRGLLRTTDAFIHLFCLMTQSIL